MKERRGLLLSLNILAVSSALLLSLLTRFTDFFFLPTSSRYIILIVSFLVPALLVIVVRVKINRLAYQFQDLLSKRPFLKIILVINLVCSSVLTFYIPKAKFPLSHSLTIEVLPDEAGGENHILIKRIRKQFDEPEPGSQFIDLEELDIEGRQFEFLDNGLYMRENTKASYETFFSGCISIFLDTSPDAGMIRVQFDQIEERYSLFSPEKTETEVQVCAPLSMQRLSIKWKLIVIGLYIVDSLSLFALLCVLEILVYWFVKLRNDPQKYGKFIIACFLLVAIVASIDQITQICLYPSSRNTANMPPLKPSTFQDGFDFGSLYQQSIHTKKFAHAFIINFIDLYPSVEHVYIDDKTMEEYGFGSFEFQRWFAVYNPQPADELHFEISGEAIENFLETAPWEEREIYLEERDKTFYLDHLDRKANKFVFITNIGVHFYLIPDVLLEESKEGY